MIVTVEVRPGLQICNVFVRLSKEIDSSNAKINVLEESIDITIGNSITKFLTGTVKLIPSSLSSLNVISNWIYFRAQIKSSSAFGRFKTELIPYPMLDPEIHNFAKKWPELQNTRECNIICSCCKNILTNKINVKRILPIPDMHLDPSDWFCCKHKHNSIIPSLSPLESDIFHGQFFFILRTSLFNQNLKKSDDSVLCSRCLQHIGKVYTNNSLKLWSCAVEYNSLNSSTIQKATNPFSDFLMAIKTSMTGIIGEEIVLQSFVGEETHSLVLKPMDWNLNLLTEPKEFPQTNVVALERVSVVKVLYKYDITRNTTNCLSKAYCEVSFLVIKTGLEHLKRSTKRFPHGHRLASDFYIGHISLENPAIET